MTAISAFCASHREVLEKQVAEIAPHLDPGIRVYVETLMLAGIETFESCQGGEGHAYTEPTVRFHGQRAEGFRAFTVASEHRYRVSALRRTWPIIDGEPTGPYWEMTFWPESAQGKP